MAAGRTCVVGVCPSPADENKVIEHTRKEAFKVFQNDDKRWLGTPLGKK